MRGSRCCALSGARVVAPAVGAAYLAAVCPGACVVAPERSQITIYNHISCIIPNRVKIALIIDVNQ